MNDLEFQEPSEDTKLPAVSEVGHSIQADSMPKIPTFRRDISPSNVSLSSEDLAELFSVVSECNERAKEFELEGFDLSQTTPDDARNKIDELMQIEYSYSKRNLDDVMGLGEIDTTARDFPEELQTYFLSNVSFAQRQANVRPANTVELFLDFDRPTMKMDLQTMPSNATENRSIINIAGRNEDWVIATTVRIRDFLSERAVKRPLIHGAGTYDYFLYLAYIPIILWMVNRIGLGKVDAWAQNHSILINLFVGLYLFLVSLLFARFAFQYARWLFPPMEFYKKRKTVSQMHRAAFTVVFLSIGLAALYDIVKWIVNLL